MLLFRDPTEALPGELSIVYPLAGAQADTEGIVVFKKGPAIDRALTTLFSCPSEGREEDPRHGFWLRRGDPPLPATTI